MKKLILVALLLVSQTLTAQEKQLNKCFELIEANKLEKALNKAYKYQKKFSKQSEFHSVEAQIYFAQFSNDSSVTLLNKAVNAANTAAKKRNFTLIDSPFQLFYNELFVAATNYSNQQLVAGNHRTIKVLNNKINRIYGVDLTAAIQLDSIQNERILASQNLAKLGGGSGPNFGSTQETKALLNAAHQLIGVPYRYGGDSPQTGFDCSGFTQYVYAQNGVSLPHNAQLQSIQGARLPINQAQPGDLIFFGSTQPDGSHRAFHAGIVNSIEPYFSVIHCVSGGVHIAEENTPNWDSYWKNKVLFVTRIPVKNTPVIQSGATF